MTPPCEQQTPTRWTENRLGLDYRLEAASLGAPASPIVDAHTHIHGIKAARVYKEVRELFGVARTYSMSTLSEVSALRDFFGDSIDFIAVPDFNTDDRKHAHTAGFLDSIERFHALGSRVVKFWSAPRARDYGREVGEPDLLALDSHWRLEAMNLAESLGMMFMTHVADPNTWFEKKYNDAREYGSKLDQYIALERALDRFTTPWIAAHMGGWPEDLVFLDALLTRHDNLHLDTSATKWMVRELSKQPRDELVAFLIKWKGRILFGSDIVTMDEHLAPAADPVATRSVQASSPREAFDLYASRYWALRTLFETEYEGESSIADPDLAMVDPDQYDEMSAPTLRGKSIPSDLLQSLYRGAAVNLLDRWRRDHP